MAKFYVELQCEVTDTLAVCYEVEAANEAEAEEKALCALGDDPDPHWQCRHEGDLGPITVAGTVKLANE